MSEIEYRELDEYAGLFAGSDGNIYTVTDSEIIDGRRYVRVTKAKTYVCGHYETVRVMRKADLIEMTANVHALVCEAFHEKPKGIKTLHVRHLNGNSHDNRPCNLAYGTPHENWEDKKLSNTATMGEKNGRAKLTDLQRREVCDMYSRGCSQNNIATRFGVTQSNICKIIASAQAAEVIERLTDEDVQSIVCAKGDAICDIMAAYGITIGAARKILDYCYFIDHSRRQKHNPNAEKSA